MSELNLIGEPEGPALNLGVKRLMALRIWCFLALELGLELGFLLA
jgi:hypothetical protein